MLEIDECPDDKQRNKNPVCDRHLPGEALPDREEKKRREQFHGKIAKGDFATAVCAATVEQKPADQWQILMPGDRPLARGAKRAAWLVDREIDRETIDADVQKRADRGAENKSERAEEKFVRGTFHADQAIDLELRRSMNHAIQMQLS
jgi:hypothetical protein